MGFKFTAAYFLVLLAYVQARANNSSRSLDYQEACGNTEKINIGSEYVLNNNIWGSGSDGAGMQCVWYDSGSGKWGVNSGHTDGAADDIKGYPAICAGWLWFDDAGSLWARPENNPYPVQISQIASLTSSWDVTVPLNGEDFDTAYDIWLDPNPNPNYKAQYEIMIWLNRYGHAYNGDDFVPVGPQVGSNVNIAGHTWDIFTGWNGGNNVYSFRRTQNTNTFNNLDVNALIQYSKNAGFVQDSWYLLGVQAGWEIVSGGAWSTNSFSLNLQKR